MALFQRQTLSTMSYHFNRDLKEGQKVENEVKAMLESYGLNVTSTQNQYLFEGYDLIVTTDKSVSLIEVKEDKIAEFTCNVAVEIARWIT